MHVDTAVYARNYFPRVLSYRLCYSWYGFLIYRTDYATMTWVSYLTTKWYTFLSVFFLSILANVTCGWNLLPGIVNHAFVYNVMALIGIPPSMIRGSSQKHGVLVCVLLNGNVVWCLSTAIISATVCVTGWLCGRRWDRTLAQGRWSVGDTSSRK